MMLEIKNLVKNYGKFQAVKGISFSVKEGRIFGFVGPNGAGKTTTMRIIATLQEATSGTVLVNGIDVQKEPAEVRKLIGYMPDFFGVYDNLKVSEYLDFYSSCYGLAFEQRKRICDELLELVDLAHKRDSYVNSLSRGMKQRLCLARSLAHDPKLLILDEPASGLDPRARIEMRELLKELKEMGKTIIISSHILPELADICTDIGIIENGEMIVTGTVEEVMLRASGCKVLRIKVLADQEAAISQLKEEPMVTNLTLENGFIHAGFTGDSKDMARILSILVSRGIPIVSFSEMDSNLEDIFMKVTKGVVG